MRDRARTIEESLADAGRDWAARAAAARSMGREPLRVGLAMRRLSSNHPGAPARHAVRTSDRLRPLGLNLDLFASGEADRLRRLFSPLAEQRTVGLRR